MKATKRFIPAWFALMGFALFAGYHVRFDLAEGDPPPITGIESLTFGMFGIGIALIACDLLNYYLRKSN
jgi:hypothetical protein